MSARFAVEEREGSRSVPTNPKLTATLDHEIPFVFTPLLETKLHPPQLPARLVERPRLLELLDDGQGQKLTLLHAPAGFGKTTLVLQWIAHLKDRASAKPHPSPAVPPSEVAWFSLDRGDNDPVRFWSSLIRAYQVIQAHLGQTALAQLSQILRWPFPPVQFETVPALLLNDLEHSDIPLLLVVEDYHLIEDTRLHETMTFFVEHLPAHMRLVILTRSEPPLPLVRWRARGDLLDVQRAYLRFSVEETALFLHQAIPQGLSQEAARRLSLHLEGWAAGLRLVALNWQSLLSPEAIEEALSHLNANSASDQPHRLLQEFFLHEVLSSQPEALQLFLLQTSMLSRLTSSLCNAVTGRRDSAAWLEMVLRSGLFLEVLERTTLPLSTEQEWYRYHGIFAATMRAEAVRRLGEGTLRDLALKASRWYEAHAMQVEAIEAALSAREFGRAASLIEQLNENAYFSEHHTMRRWVEQLPEAILRAHPIVCFLAAQAQFFSDPSSSRKEQRDDFLQMAEEGMRESENLPLLSVLDAFRALLAIHQGHSHLAIATAHARQALRLLPIDAEQAHDKTHRQPAVWIDWRIGCLIAIGGEYMQEGSFAKAHQFFLEAHARSVKSNERVFIGVIATMLGEICIELGELHLAASYYQQTVASARSQNEALAHAAAICGLARLSYEWNQLEAAWTRLAAAEQLVREAFDDRYRDHFWAEEAHTNVELLKILLLHERGETLLAQQRLRTLFARLQAISSSNILLLIPDVLSVQARLQMRDGDLVAAARTLNFLDSYEHMMFPLQQETQHLLRARLRLAQGERETVLPVLARLLVSTQQNQHKSRALEIQLLLTRVHFDLKQRKLAHQQLALVLLQARNEGFVRLFLNEGEPLAVLLRSLLPTVTEKPLRAYARSILHAFPAERNFAKRPGRSGDSPFGPLSTQEQRVLALLVAGRSNPEIAETLIVSVNTIKAHVKNLYRKLGVTNRVEAVEVARRDHLL
ncbi:MAG TPA: LuxR C-terminal-related transcriptional regulator [Ktedonobacteraceae bacterium]|nr:LuxR C-terminal-related transcriptional regulator [Ktedonobacteraceae bacterium]